MNRRQFLAAGFAASALAFRGAAAAARPNVILMMADDMGWGDPAFNGNRIIHTPNLDAMAQAGIWTEFAPLAPTWPARRKTEGD